MPEKTPQPAGTLPVIRLSDASVWTDPHPVFRAARETAPAGRTDSGHVIVFRRHLVDEVMRDTARFVNILTSQFYTGEQTAIDEHWRYVMGGMMPPEHTRLRRFVSSAFTPRRVEQLRPLVAGWATAGTRAELEASGDIRADDGLLAEIPVRVVAHLLGVPEPDRQWFAGLGLRFGRLFATNLAQDQPAVRDICDAIGTLSDYGRTLVAARRARPTADLLSSLVEARDGTDRLSELELVNLVVNIMWAGVDTTRAAIPIVLNVLARVPDQADALRRDPALIPNAVEEILRLEPPVFHSVRRCVDDVAYDGIQFRAGEFVQLNYLSASRDPRAWEEPERIWLERPGVHAMAFGQGLHYCLGSSLARLELQEIVRAVLAHTGRVTLAGEPVWEPFTILRHLTNVTMAVAA